MRADHADDVGFMLGGCFWDGPLKIIGRVSVQYVCIANKKIHVLDIEAQSINQPISILALFFVVKAFLFISSGNVTKEDKSVCRTMMAYWASFVRNG